jgi:hypothetical protein
VFRKGAFNAVYVNFEVDRFCYKPLEALGYHFDARFCNFRPEHMKRVKAIDVYRTSGWIGREVNDDVKIPLMIRCMPNLKQLTITRQDIL